MDQSLLTVSALLLCLIKGIFSNGVSKIYIQLSKDDGSEETWSKTMDLLSPDFSSAPDWTKAEHHHQPVKRSTFAEMLLDMGKKEKRAESCIRRHSAVSTYASQMAALGESVYLPCRFCDDPPGISLAGHLWYKFKKQVSKEEMIWRAAEVRLDMHDEDSKNRVYIRPDHTLVIRNLQMEDRGAYFCENYMASHISIDEFHFMTGKLDQISSIAMLTAWQALSYEERGHVTFMTHLDVELQITPTLVLEEGAGRHKIRPPLVEQRENWMASTEWQEWGLCNNCDVLGERKREGRCRVTAVDDQVFVESLYMEEVLRLYPDGAPCHSSLFVHLGKSLLKYPVETEVSICNITCSEHLLLEQSKEKPISPMDSITDRLTIEKMSGKPKPRQETLNRDRMSHVTMPCPGSSLETPVRWMNGTQQLFVTSLLAKTNPRITIDSSNTLQITSLRLTDAGVFGCYYGGSLKTEYTLVVKDIPGLGNVFEYIYYLHVTYLGNLLIFVSVMGIRHFQRARPVGRRAVNKQIEAQEEESDSSNDDYA